MCPYTLAVLTVLTTLPLLCTVRSNDFAGLVCHGELPGTQTEFVKEVSGTRQTLFHLLELNPKNTILQNTFTLDPVTTLIENKSTLVIDLACARPEDEQPGSVGFAEKMKVNYASANGLFLLKSNREIAHAVNERLHRALGLKLVSKELEDVGMGFHLVPQVFLMDYPDDDTISRIILQNYADDIEFLGTTWMSKVSDDVSLHDLYIPGTHDTLAIEKLNWCATPSGGPLGGQDLGAFTFAQDKELLEQLQVGIRWFDIRLVRAEVEHAVNGERDRVVETSIELVGAHGPFLFDINIQQVLSTLVHFVVANPQEVVFMNIKLEFEPNKKNPKNWVQCAWGTNSTNENCKQDPMHPGCSRVPYILPCNEDKNFLQLFKEAADALWQQESLSRLVVNKFDQDAQVRLMPDAKLQDVRGSLVLVNNFWDSNMHMWNEAFDGWDTED